jgi:dihydroorotate dehydrogenase
LAGVFQTLEGGWSGRPLKEISRKSLIEARRVSRKPIISVGGIETADEAVSRISEGADLLQIYTGWIYQGPSFPEQVRKRIDSI